MTSSELKHQAKLQNWVTIVHECRSSGLSVRQWCRQQEITPTTYYRWEREVLAHANIERTVPVSEKAVTFAEVPAIQQKRNDSERAATIRINEVSVDIYNGINSALLKCMLELLQLC